MTDHSNLPWRAAKGGFLMAPDGPNREVQVGKIGDFSDKELLRFNRDRWQDDLELIVKAVNNHDALTEMVKLQGQEIGITRERDEALTEALEKIAAMDPFGVRADDLGRAARVAREALGSVGGPVRD